jgi:hypothetical protein
MVHSQLRQIVLETLSWKKPIIQTKKDWWSGGVAQGVCPKLKPQYRKKKKKILGGK